MLKYPALLILNGIIFIMLSTNVTFSPIAKAETVEIAVLSTSSQQRAVYAKHEKNLKLSHPNIQLNIKFLSDTDFKQDLNQWLNKGSGPDILTWQGGQRLFQLVKKDQVKDLTSFWDKHDLNSRFSAGAIDAISVDNSRYGVPASYYQWGLYYRESLFESLNITAPTTWDELITVCKVMLQNDITPITIGAANKWTSAAWFDYLNLRINGLTFHQELLVGEHSFNSKQVRAVFSKWKELLDSGCFTDRFNGWDWTQAMPFLYHKMAGMTLIGNFFASSLPQTLKDDFRFAPFPIIEKNIPRYEEAPLDLMMVPNYAQLSDDVETVLLSLTSNAFLSELNNASSMISPVTDNVASEDYFTNEGQKLLQEAKGLSQFFDRDTNAEMASAATIIFTDFMGHKDIDEAIAELEDARKRYLIAQSM
ncbi:ABC transporter substrate-binding protein [Glaciecola petra]|uniref:Extracellular solute-binding protein n=1 Tax=Glaciecola petra TaxID=3075602 RepID=A0ABU2ZSS5_9ALTE|nr:extracellular solute-binding protein [Aestuariibacter sp. P117]MDT0595088.1 extracellular solute-binding protein [Aestuariibacter sp. P117]